MGKSTKKTHKPKSEDTNQKKLYLFHMDICGPMRIESINGKKYILVIVDDYSRFTWSDVSEQTMGLSLLIKRCGIIIKRRNRTLIEAARTMLIYAQASLFLWAEAVATVCFTQNQSIIRLSHGKTPYELMHVTEVQKIFKQMELAVEQHCVEKTKMENVLKENDRLLTQALSVEIVNNVVHDCMNDNYLNVDACEHCVTTESELKTDFIKKECYEKLLQHGDVKERKVERDIEEIETLNLELDHKVTKLAAENNHLKQTYKQLFDSIKSSRVQSKEQCDDLINKVNLKSVEVADLNASLQEKVLVITALKEQLKGKAEKDTVILKLKEKIKSLRADDKERKVESKVEDIETQNLELDHR
nr:hypothetical protein [Tanacetum cinerariifolium]